MESFIIVLLVACVVLFMGAFATKLAAKTQPEPEETLSKASLDELEELVKIWKSLANNIEYNSDGKWDPAIGAYRIAAQDLSAVLNTGTRHKG